MTNILFLTIDRQIDRRTLQQVDALEKHGFAVRLVAPLNKHPNYHLSKFKKFFISLITRNQEIYKLSRMLFWLLHSPENYYKKLFNWHDEAFKPDVVIAVDLPVLASAYTIAQHYSAKLIYDTHELYPEQGFYFPEKFMWYLLEKKYINKTDLVITVNESLSEQLKRVYGLDAVVLLNSLRPYEKPKTNIIRERLNLDEHHKIVLYQGGLIHGRNLENLVKAIEHVEMINIHLVFLGEGLRRESLKKLVAKLRLNNRVHFLDAVPQDELLKYTKSADLGIIPYVSTCINNHYCTPNKLYEFISCGLPFVSHQLPELERLRSIYGLSIAVDFNDPSSVGCTINYIFSNPDILSRLSEACSVAAKSISWDFQSMKFLQYVDQLLS